MKISAALIFILIPALAFCESGIDPVALKREGLDGYIVVDLRDLKSYEEGRIPGALHITLDTLKKTHRVVTSKARVLVYGEEGQVKEALKILERRGIRAYYLRGGIKGWIEAGGAIQGGPAYMQGLPDRFTVPRGLCESLPPAEVYGD